MSTSLVRLVALLPFTALLAAGCGASSTGGLGDNGDDASNDALASDASPGDAASADAAPDGTLGDAGLDANGDDALVAETPVFETGAPLGPAPVLLRSAGAYVILAESAISSAVPSIITGDLGISPAAATLVTGFSMTRAGTYWTASQVVGRVFAADNDSPTPAVLTLAIADMLTAYTDAAGRPTPDYLNLSVGAIGGSTLAPGLYKWASSVTIGADLTLSGGANDTWVFQISGDLMESAAKRVTLSGGATAKNVVWQVAGHVEIATNAHLEGVVLCKTDIALRAGASIHGRLLAQTAVNVETSTVTQPSP